ncbi:MAG: hypothetical protein ABI830_05330 [Pseudolabrys sp.]
MTDPLRRLRLCAALIASFLCLAIEPIHAEPASADDTARYIAGMPVPDSSPLTPLTKDRGWQQHAGALDQAFAAIEKRQLAPIRTWVAANMKSPQPTLYYMFSGPDFLYANAFFPDAKTYVLAGLEPTGEIPDLLKMHRGAAVPGLAHLHNSIRTLLAVSFFITKEMRENLGDSGLRGTIPILYVFLARSGKTIRDVDLVLIDEDGNDRPNTGRGVKSAAHGVKIKFTGADGGERTLYYFKTDLANGVVNKSGFLKFLEKLGPANSFAKSASFLMHSGNFSQIREFLLTHSSAILQDDSGVPLKAFDMQKWALQPYGRFAGPNGLFPESHQPKIAELFKKGSPGKLEFGFGYSWRPGDSNLLLAIKNP